MTRGPHSHPGSQGSHGSHGSHGDEGWADSSELAGAVRGWFTGRLPQDWFTGPVEVEVDREEITVILTLAIPALDDVGYWTSHEAVQAEELPRSMAVLGGGATGVEMAQVFARFGVHVTIVEAADQGRRQDGAGAQHRGGPKGFIHRLDEKTLAFADYRGNRQYITQGNLADNPKAFIIAIDYGRRQRVKIWGHARVIDDEEGRRIVVTKGDLFHRIIAHGMWTGGLISAGLRTKIPPPRAHYFYQNTQVPAPGPPGHTHHRPSRPSRSSSSTMGRPMTRPGWWPASAIPACTCSRASQCRQVGLVRTGPAISSQRRRAGMC